MYSNSIAILVSLPRYHYKRDFRRRSRKRRENSQVFAPSHSHSELALLPPHSTTITPSPSPSPHHSTISISPQSSKQRLPAAEELKLISSDIKGNIQIEDIYI